ncbi:S8 family serine peptidase [Amycolatopsis plumensis]|uniref:S8 family serine peptidase n=1 Tax=Amycolatopsis plumensis TaxID=236508 RepID=A0ABV5U1K4_9PSEU
MTRPTGRRLGHAALAFVAALAAVVAPPGASANGIAATAPARPAGKTVTLVTGDRVTLTGRDDVRVRPAPGREHVGFEQRIDENGHSVVVPRDVEALVAGGQLDPRLFDVSALVEAGYHDEARPDLPLVVTHTGGGHRNGLAGGRELPSVGATAIRPAKDAVSSVWAALDAGGGATLSPGVQRVALDGPVHVDLDHSVPQIGAPQAWQAGHTGSGTTVAVLDTGIDATHPDLADAVAGARDFTGSPGGSDDRVGHGTHVASIITGSGAASAGRFRGVAPDTRLLVGKVLDDTGNGTESSVVAGMEWAAAQGADVIAMSLSGSVASGKDPAVDVLSEAVNRLTAQSGALFVVSAGNKGPRGGSVASPGAADAALTVGAVDGDDALAEFSSRGPRADGAVKPDITAPGVGIVAARAKNGHLGTPVDDEYTAMSGTSMAAPHVAGAAAILAGMHPDWDPARLKSALMGSAAPRDGLTVYEQGAGRVDVARAVRQPVLATPASVSLGQARWPHGDDQPIPTVLTYRNTGTTPVTLDLAVVVRDQAGNPAPAGMFTVAPRTLEVPAGGQATATLIADTAVDGPDGTYGGTVVATGGGNVVRTPLGVQREAENHDVKLDFLDWQGNPAQLAEYRFVGLDRPAAYLATVRTGSTVVRLPPGRYFFHATVLGRNAGNELIRALFAEPEITVTGDTGMAVDARDAEPVGMKIDRPNAGDSETIQSFLRTTSFGETGFRDFGAFDKVWVRPSATSAPEFTFTAEGLLARRDGQGGFTGSPYLYHLRWAEQGRVPAELVRHFADRDLAAVRSTHAASGASGEIGERDYTVRAPLPFTLQEYYSPDTPWERFFGKPVEKPLYEWSTQTVPRTFRRGESVAEHWNTGVLGPAFPPYPGSPAEWAGRAGDTVYFDLAPFSDPSSGHYGQSVTDSAETVLDRGDERIGGQPWAGYHEFDVPPGESPYRLHSESARSSSAGLSTRVTADWTFRSGTVPGAQVRPIPLMAVRFTPWLDDHNRAPGGVPFVVPVRVEHTEEQARITSLKVGVSYDDGGTWRAVPVWRGDGQWLAGLRHPAGAAFVSLRATATDGAGNTVDQTIIRGYRLR